VTVQKLHVSHATIHDHDDDGGDDGSGGGDIDHDSDRSSWSFLAHRDVAAAKHRRSDPPPVVSQTRPKARPRYHGVPTTSHGLDNAIPDDTSPRRGTADDGDVRQAQQEQDHLPRGATRPVLPPILLLNVLGPDSPLIEPLSPWKPLSARRCMLKNPSFGGHSRQWPDRKWG
jgi:hypothetical protein